MSHTSAPELVCHFWRVGFPLAETSSRLDYSAVNLVPSSHPGWKREMSNVPSLRVEDVSYKNKLSDLGYKTMLQPDWKNVNLLQDIMCKAMKSGDLVLHAC